MSHVLVVTCDRGPICVEPGHESAGGALKEWVSSAWYRERGGSGAVRPKKEKCLIYGGCPPIVSSMEADQKSKIHR